MDVEGWNLEFPRSLKFELEHKKYQTLKGFRLLSFHVSRTCRAEVRRRRITFHASIFKFQAFPPRLSYHLTHVTYLTHLTLVTFSVTAPPPPAAPHFHSGVYPPNSRAKPARARLHVSSLAIRFLDALPAQPQPPAHRSPPCRRSPAHPGPHQLHAAVRP